MSDVHFEAVGRDQFRSWTEREMPRTVVQSERALAAVLDEMRDDVRATAGPLHETFQEHWTVSMHQPVPFQDPYVLRVEVARKRKSA